MPHRGPRSLLSRILDRGRGGAGFGCRIRLLPRCYASASAAAVKDEPVEVASPTAVGASQPAPRENGSPSKLSWYVLKGACVCPR
jgi:hypothetical protein